ncbi:MAG: GT-D fold domain-containing glycosyltransferase [Muribaculaceae bacterium]|nr:GT-D fold domain-containing glycosyltransferase [Muribaculaceae bacterium]
MIVNTARIKIWLSVLNAYFRTFGGVKSDIDDAEETVAKILEGKSLIRFGDGEFGIYRGCDIHYQPWSEELWMEFQKIKSDFDRFGSRSPYILAVPKKYMQCTGFELAKKRVLVSSWAQSRLLFKRMFDTSHAYGDSFLFEKKNRTIYSRIWQQPSDDRLIIFVHNNSRYADSFARTYNRSVEYVACPAHDAFASWSTIYDAIIDAISEKKLGPDDVQIVLSAGPAGKVLCYHLSGLGYQCIDAGHCWDDPLES